MRPNYQLSTSTSYPRKVQYSPQLYPHSPTFKPRLHKYPSPTTIQNHHTKFSNSQPNQVPSPKPSFLSKKLIEPQLFPHKTPQDGKVKINVNNQQQNNEEIVPNLRITCPNFFNKVEISSLRKTSNNLPKFEHEEDKEGKKSDIVNETNNMKKKGNYELYHSLNNPEKCEKKNQLLSKKSPNSIKQDQLKFQMSCGPKSLNEMLKKNRQIQMVMKQSTSTAVDLSFQLKQEKDSKIINGFYVLKEIGVGKFGNVYLAKHMQTGFFVALKKIIKAKIKQYNMINQLKEQIRLHNCLNHPNIVKFYGFFQQDEAVYLIMEYIQGGTLFDALNEKDKFSIKQAVNYVKCTLEALAYMHDKSIAHRDIKPQNIVIASQGVAKLCDFGWSALVQSSRNTYCGTFDYVPPEVLEQKGYDKSVDIWCIGILTYELLTGRVPFEGEKKKQVISKILNVDKSSINYPFELPSDAKEFMESIIEKDPKLRPKCKDLLRHRFIINNIAKK